jgi:hypothetical protein
MGTEPKNVFFITLPLTLMVLGFFAAAKQTNKFELGQNLKLVVVAFGPICTVCSQ